MIEVQESYNESLSEALPVESDRDYCPECGRLWHAVSNPWDGRSEKPAWWGMAMVAAGIYLIVFFGPLAWLAVRGDTFQRVLPTVTCLTAGTEQDYADCDPTKARAGAATGLVWTAIGFGMIARSTMLKRRRTNLSSPRGTVDPSTSDPLVNLGQELWTFVETAGRSFFQLQLILFCYIGSSQLIEGAPPSWTLVARAIDRGIIVVHLI